MTNIIDKAKAALEDATPGPWKAVRNRAFWEVNPRHDAGGKNPWTVADCCASDPSDTKGLQEPNARLIALAPDLARIAIAAEELAGEIEWRLYRDMVSESGPLDEALANYRKAVAGCEWPDNPTEIGHE